MRTPTEAPEAPGVPATARPGPSPQTRQPQDGLAGMLGGVRPTSLVTSLLAALTTWVTLVAWSPFAEDPAGFLVPLIGTCALIAVSGIALRSARLPALVVLPGQLLLLLLWFTNQLAGDAALGGLVPTPSSVRAIVDAVNAAAVVSQSYAAPVPVTAPEFYPLLVVTGSLTAVLVDFLAVGLRRAPLAGLPLLAVYTAPVSILDGGVSWGKFAAAALCFLFLIAAGEEERLARWGHHLTPAAAAFEPGGRTAGSQAVWSSARKIGLTATALAVVVPVLLPTFSGTLFGGGHGDGDGDGDAVSISNPMADLKRDLTQGADVDVIRLTTNDPDPSYLRISVLNTFDGNAWRPSARDIPVKQRADGALPRPPGLVDGVPSRTYSMSIRVPDTFESRWLPTPYPATSVNAPGDWRYDRSTLDFISAAEGQTTAGLSYQVRSQVLSPRAAQLADALPAPLSVFTPNTALPRGVPDYVRTLARTVTAGQPTRFEQAVALQRFFREDGGFRYSLERSPGNGSNELLRFLRPGPNGRVGYCEQYAAAMALMGRVLGIPSRVAVGFLHPDQPREGTFVYSNHDLHAWPEMYFGGVGWVRFEPTPQGRTGAVPGYTTQQVSRTPTETSSSAAPSASTSNRADRPAADQAADDASSQNSSRGALVLLVVAGAALLVLALLAPRGLRTWVRRRRWASAEGPRGWVEAGWQEVRDTATDLSVAWDDRVTLRSVAQQLRSSFGRPETPGDGSASLASRRGPDADPAATAALDRLTGLLERARYARDLQSDATTLDQVKADVDACVAALGVGAGRGRRTLATWLPRSLLGWRRSSGRRSRSRGAVLAEPGVDRTVRSGG